MMIRRYDKAKIALSSVLAAVLFSSMSLAQAKYRTIRPAVK
jgi:hypothetical protein